MMINVNKSNFRKLVRTFAFILICCTTAVTSTYATGDNPSAKPIVTQNSKVTIQGTIIDEALAEPMIGATVLEKGTTNGTLSDIDGRFSLSVTDNSTIVVSIIGFKPQEIKIQGSQTLRISMEEDTQSLEEVVVVGYGSARKQDLSMAVSSVTVDQNMKARAGGLNAVLQGKVSGMTIQMNGGDPLKGASINLRGKGSRDGDGVLVVVDGVPNAPYNVEDIENVSVLKDAASAAIYGAQVGSGGVIVITTKQAQAGKVKVEVNANYGFKNAWKRPDVLTSEQFTQVWQDKKNSSVGNVTIPSSYDVSVFPYAGVTRTDWLDEVLRTGHNQHYSMSLTGGSESIKSLASVTFDQNDGILLNTYSKSVNARFNTDFQVTKWLKLSERLTFEYSNGRGNVSNSSHTGVLMRSILYPRSQTVYEYALNPNNPLELGEPMYNQDGSRMYGGTIPQWAAAQGISSSGDYANPVASLQRVRDNRPSVTTYSTTALEIKPITKLTVQSNFTYGYTSKRHDVFRFRVPEIGKVLDENYKNIYTQWWHKWLWESYATYVEEIGKHNFSVMGGFSLQRESNRTMNLYSYNFEDESEYQTQLPNAIDGIIQDKQMPDMDVRQVKTLNSLFARAGYSFDDRYFLTASIRRDATSNLFKDNYSGVFPAFSGSWKISSESFWKELDLSFINLFKLRGGWGQIGNVNLVPFNSYAPLYKQTEASWHGVFGQDLVSQKGYYVRSLVNYALTWETTEQTSAGLDLSFLNNSLNLSVDYFNKTTKELIEEIADSPQVGMEKASLGNIGKVRNTGWEVALDYNNRIGEVSFNVYTNLSTVNNKVLNLGSRSEYDHNYTIDGNTNPKLYSTVGQPWYSYKLHRTDGLFQTQEEIDNYTWTDSKTGAVNKIQPNAVPGDIKFLDHNNDGKINENDKEYMGSYLPKFTYAFGGGFEWKGLDFNFMFQGISNVKIYNGIKAFGQTGRDNGYMLTSVLDSWTYNHSSSVPRLSMGSDPNGNYSTPSDYFLEDGSYLRLKNLTVGYTLPKATMRKIGMDKMNLRFYIGGENLFTITDYTGFDPEVGNNGVDGGTYPVARMYTFGLNLNF